ncbi:hypothetical protein T12_6662 [Trichinella patagoniensis]|uniref:Uncharacterized protein n=1 Tax=Trichinella patagoniensis TaxID=990121 RepID=A0A0V0ZTN8_9BILA|nr:hypothetical protein T12_6662 [Trichinella patagoniensis]
MSSVKRKQRKRGSRVGSCQTDSMTADTNPPVETEASSSNDHCGSSPAGSTNEPARESGSLLLRASARRRRHSG